jgi:hypothetical protein
MAKTGLKAIWINKRLADVELIFNHDLDFVKTNLDIVKVAGLKVKVLPNPVYLELY